MNMILKNILFGSAVLAFSMIAQAGELDQVNPAPEMGLVVREAQDGTRTVYQADGSVASVKDAASAENAVSKFAVEQNLVANVKNSTAQNESEIDAITSNEAWCWNYWPRYNWYSYYYYNYSYNYDNCN